VPPGDESADRSITMWGPPSTGKTTFLAALAIALLRHGPVWRVKGVDEASADELTKMTLGLTRGRSFPPGTVGIAHYRWAMHGRLERKVRRRWFGYRLREQDVRIRLDLVDSQGKLTSPDMQDLTARADLINNLMNSSAIIFLYDPIREADYDGDAFGHTFGVLQQMAQRSSDSPDGRLPHYVAVCVTKFDERRILQTAEKLNLLDYDIDAPRFPKVPDRFAKELFTELCKVESGSEAELVPQLLEQNFMADRIKYFITSAIGFYVDERTGNFNPGDYLNHLFDEANPREARIRGSIRPINIVEPMLWLADMLTAEPGD
jgi:hypothetical protein